MDCKYIVSGQQRSRSHCDTGMSRCCVQLFVSIIMYFLFYVAASHSEVWCTEITLYFKLCFKYLVGTVILTVWEYSKVTAHDVSDFEDMELKMRPLEGRTESFLMSY